MVLSGNKEEIEKYLESNADVGITDKWGETAIHIAAIKDNTEVVELLLTLGLNVNINNNHGSTPLHHAAGEGILSMVEYLIQLGADCFSRDNSGNLPIKIASLNGQTSIVKRMLEFDKIIDIQGLSKMTPLHCAIRTNSRATMLLLLEAGTSLTQKDKYGDTPKMFAEKLGRREILERERPNVD